jgi:ribosomal subunit interface protein
MLAKVDMTAKGFHLSEVERDYISTRVSEIDTYIPKGLKKGATADVIVKQGTAHGRIAYLAELILHISKGPITSHAAGSSVEEAVDLAESKLKSQVVKFKNKRVSVFSIRHKLFRRKKANLPLVPAIPELAELVQE